MRNLHYLLLKRKLFLISFIVLISNTAISQNKTKERFNLKAFEKFKNDPPANLNRSYFTMYEDSDKYVQRSRKKNSPIFEFKTFYKNTLFLKERFTLLYSMEMGTHEKYDENGILMEKYDLGNEYKYSIKNLVKTIKKKYRVDILIYNGSTSISREKNKNGRPIYQVVIPKDKVGYEVLMIEFDGDTGKIINERK